MCRDTTWAYCVCTEKSKQINCEKKKIEHDIRYQLNKNSSKNLSAQSKIRAYDDASNKFMVISRNYNRQVCNNADGEYFSVF